MYIGNWYMDTSHLFFIIPALVLSFFAQYKVRSSFTKYSSVPSDRGMTGMDAAKMVLNYEGVTDVRIGKIGGNLTDNYNPSDKLINLSESVYDCQTVAAVGVAAHEAGHAVQYNKGYFPVKIRNAIIPVTKITSNLAMPLFIAGIIFSFDILMSLGIIFFAVALFFQLVTLPVEFDASRRAVAILKESGQLSEENLRAVKKVLSAAALTYVAATLMALSNLLRLITIAGNRRSSR